MGKYPGGTVGFEIRQHDGNNLRMFKPNYFSDGLGIHPLHRLQAIAAAAHQDSIDNAARLVTQGLLQHAANIGIVTDTERSLGFEHIEKVIDDILDRRP